MRTRQMLFGTRQRDGLAYIEPLPSFHPLYKFHKKLIAVGCWFGRFFQQGGNHENRSSPR